MSRESESQSHLGSSGPRSEIEARAAFTPPGVAETLRLALLVCLKDVRIELRTREIVTTGGFFAVLVAIMASVSFYTGASQKVAPGAIWLAIAFASVLALGRSWQREREDSALVGLLVAPIPRAAIYWGKALGLFLFVTALELVVVPLVAVMFHIDLLEMGARLGVTLFFGTLGVATTGSLFGAMTVRTRARDLVLATVLFPLLSPTLLSGVAATRELFVNAASWQELRDYFVLLGTFDAMSFAMGSAVFGMLIED